MRATLVLILGGLALPLAAQTDWPTFGHDLAGTRFSPLRDITAANVSKLTRAWTYHMKTGGPGASAADDARAGVESGTRSAATGTSTGDTVVLRGVAGSADRRSRFGTTGVGSAFAMARGRVTALRLAS